MIAVTAKLVSEFEALRVEEKQEFVREIIHHLPPWDSGTLNDDVAAAAGDQLAAMLGEEKTWDFGFQNEPPHVGCYEPKATTGVGSWRSLVRRFFL